MGNLTEMYRKATMSKEQLNNSTVYSICNDAFDNCCKTKIIRRNSNDVEPRYTCQSCNTNHNSPLN